jgi:hypothetical protein
MDHLTGSQIRFKKNEQEITAVIIGTYIKPSAVIGEVWFDENNYRPVEGVASETYILCMEMKLPAKVFHHVRAQDILDMPGIIQTT